LISEVQSTFRHALFTRQEYLKFRNVCLNTLKRTGNSFEKKRYNIFMKRYLFRLSGSLIILVITSLLGCAHVISKELREKADKELSFTALLNDPDKYVGRFVILGGIIASSADTEEGTFIEVVQNPLNSRGKPQDTDVSEGRFLVLCEGYLDSAIYSQGTEVTVAGKVIGKRVRPLGEIQYTYPLIKSSEIHLFTPSRGIPIRFGIGIFKTF
jgi:outer membrane lipoprotein